MIELHAEKARVKLHLRALFMGQDLCILLDGGDKPHIGAISTVSHTDQNVYGLPSHREDDLAAEVAKAVQEYYGYTVTCLCGIHIKNISREEIALVYTLSRELTQRLLQEIQFFLRDAVKSP